MNFQNFRKQLTELNDFFNYIENRFKDQQLSDIDRDTLVDYVRDLYKVAVIQHKENNTILPFPKNEQKEDYSFNKEVIVETMPAAEQVAESTTSFVFEMPQTPVAEEQAPAVEEIAESTTSFVFEMPQTPVAEEQAPAVEEIAENTTSFVFEMPQTQAAQEQAPAVEEIAENTTSFVFEMPQTQVAQEQAVIMENTHFEIVEPIEEAYETVEETAMVIVEQPISDETALSIRASTEMSAQPNNNQPQIILNTIMDDEMFEERKARFNPEYDDLFYIKTSNDLSAKLAEKRIDDLNKAMGFNDKFLYINELFGGNAIKFKTAIEYFNNEVKTLNDARVYIERELIENFNWNSALKSNLAKDFIKLLRRRYLKV